MSRVFQNKRLDLVNLEAVTSDEVWDKDSIKKGKPLIRKDIDLFGRVDKGTSAFVKSTNMKGNNFKFIEDTHKLPKKTKNKIIDLLDNKNKKVVYLVKKKK